MLGRFVTLCLSSKVQYGVPAITDIADMPTVDFTPIFFIGGLGFPTTELCDPQPIKSEYLGSVSDFSLAPRQRITLGWLRERRTDHTKKRLNEEESCGPPSPSFMKANPPVFQNFVHFFFLYFSSIKSLPIFKAGLPTHLQSLCFSFLPLLPLPALFHLRLQSHSHPHHEAKTTGSNPQGNAK